MGFANILVHLDSSPRTAARLDIAVGLAERDGARLTGLFAEKSEAHVVGSVASWPPARYTEAVAAARAAFAAGAARLGERAAFVDLNRGGDAEILTRFAAIGRSFDIIVLGQTESGAAAPAKLPEHVITESGRPVLVVPYVGTYAEVGRRPIFAWHASRGSARAMADALPLVAKDCEALVIEAGKPNAPRDEFADLVVAHLAAHGVQARFQQLAVTEVNVMDMLLSAASDHAADLLAIGAFDQGGLALFGHGVGTRFILAHMTLPTLFSH